MKIFFSFILFSFVRISNLGAHDVFICPEFNHESAEKPPEERLGIHFLGGKIRHGYLQCFYGVGTVSDRVFLDKKSQNCSFAVPQQNKVKVRNLPDCLGSAEECRVICR